jgi:hypothetical protein
MDELAHDTEQGAREALARVFQNEQVILASLFVFLRAALDRALDDGLVGGCRRLQ